MWKALEPFVNFFWSIVRLPLVFLLHRPTFFNAFFTIYHRIAKPHNYWKDRDVPYQEPLKIFGNMKPYWDGEVALPCITQSVYNTFSSRSKCVGFYQFNVPMLLLCDPNLIKQITEQDSEYFPGHRKFASDTADPLWSKNLFVMEGGDEWQRIRRVLLNAFTGNKQKFMFDIINDHAVRFTFALLQQNHLVMEMKEEFRKVTNDIIAEVAFGYMCNSMEDPDNEFFVMCKKASDIGGEKWTFFAASLLPWLRNCLFVNFINTESGNYFRKMIIDAIQTRERNNIVKNDMIQLMLEAKSSHEEITNDVIASIAAEFFLAGFETTATALTYTAYELAINPEIQKELLEEIEETLRMCDEQLTFNVLKEMKYLNMVVLEALRKWPPFAITDRKLAKPYTLRPQGERPIPLEGDVMCGIPILSVHRDERFYPNPETFNPRRFEEENPHVGESQYTFLSFGAGKRKCIGKDFAILEIKTIIFYLVWKFEIVPVGKTPIPIVFSPEHVNPLPDGGIQLGLLPRESSTTS